MYTYRTHGTCSRAINYDIIDGKVYNVEFVGGCHGNAQGVSRLCDGRPVSDIIALLQGVQCRSNTSCPDQLAKALMQHITQE